MADCLLRFGDDLKAQRENAVIGALMLFHPLPDRSRVSTEAGKRAEQGKLNA